MAKVRQEEDLVGDEDTPGEGHNSGGIAGGQLRSYVERIERLEEEKKGIADDIKDVFSEAKGNGFDAKIMRKVLAIRKRDAAEIEEEESLVDLYLRALGHKR